MAGCQHGSGRSSAYPCTIELHDAMARQDVFLCSWLVQ